MNRSSARGGAKRRQEARAPLYGLLARRTELMALPLLALALFLSFALLSHSVEDPGWSSRSAHEIGNWGGVVGAWSSDILLWLFGYASWMAPLLLLAVSLRLLAESRFKLSLSSPLISVLGVVVLLPSLAALLSLNSPTSGAPPLCDAASGLPCGHGGLIGQALASELAQSLGYTGGRLSLLMLILIGVSLGTGLSWLAIIDYLGIASLFLISAAGDRARRGFELTRAWRQKSRAMAKVKAAEKAAVAPIDRQLPLPESSPEALVAPKALPPRPKKTVQKVAAQPAAKEKNRNLFGGDKVKGEPQLPPSVDLLSASHGEQRNYTDEELQMLSQRLESNLADFKIEAKVTGIYPGPVITRFEVKPAPGIKVSRISALAKDLARSLAVSSVRVVEIISGKEAVGIEIPNQDRATISLHEILSSGEWKNSSATLPLALGQDISGGPVVVDLAKMPHLLVAGTTGSGKSVCVNAMLLSLLFKASPDEVRLILVDPKMLELAVYDGVPHLLTPVITDMKDAASGLRWCVTEMDRRYRLMSALGVRNLAGCNAAIKAAVDAGEPLRDPLFEIAEGQEDAEAPELHLLPSIVVIVDEFADMVMVVGKKVEELIVRLAQKARAAGIHLVLATQRPSVNVITGLIKANIPTRISFQVSTRVDSRTVLDQNGAEQLLGHGDMLYMSSGANALQRVHGAFVSDEEVHKAVADWKGRAAPDYIEELLEPAGGAVVSDAGDGDEEDDLYQQAVQCVVENRRASASFVQRRLRIGYNRAARLLEMMEERGVVSAMGSNGNREVLVGGQAEE